MNKRPDPDYEALLSQNGMPTTADQVSREFNAIADDEGLVTNTSRMSPFWRLITAIITAPYFWIKEALVNVMRNAYLATASSQFVDLFAWDVNIQRKAATAAEGMVTFVKTDIGREVVIPAGTIIQTERINGIVYQLATTQETRIEAGVSALEILTAATEPGNGHNLAPGYFRILPVAIDGIAEAETREGWLTAPGSETESDDELRERVKNQFNLVGQYHIDAVYRGMIAGIAGLSMDRIYFEHDAPRGPGTANVYLLLDAGVPSETFIDNVNDYVMSQGNHGHGDDVRCLPLPERYYDLSVSVHLFNRSHIDDNRISEIQIDITDLIRSAFRENNNFDVQKTWPFGRFSMSRLAEELHTEFREMESVLFSMGDIVSDLFVPRLQSLRVVIEND